MGKFIEVYDNFLPSKLEDLVEDTLLNWNRGLLYRYESNTTFAISDQKLDPSFNPGCSRSFLNYGYTDEWLGFFMQVLYIFCYKQNIIVDKVYRGRCFLDFPTYENKPLLPPHNDIDEPHWVGLYYANDCVGDTVFYNDNMEEIKRVTPKKGRIAFFDGSIKHTGCSSDKNVRALLNFNFTGKKL